MMRSVLNEGTGARRARAGLHARRRRQDRHDQRPARRLVRRLHAGAADRGLGRLRRQPAARPERRQAALPIWTQFMKRALAGHAEHAVRRARRHLVRRHRPRHRQARDARPARASSARRSSPAPSRRRPARSITSEAAGLDPAPAPQVLKSMGSSCIPEVFVNRQVRNVCTYRRCGRGRLPEGSSGSGATDGDSCAAPGKRSVGRRRGRASPTGRRPQIPKPVPQQLPDVVARVNGEAVKKGDFERMVQSIEARAGQPIPPDRRDEIMRGALDQLVVYTLLTQESKSRGSRLRMPRSIRGCSSFAVSFPTKMRSPRRSRRKA